MATSKAESRRYRIVMAALNTLRITQPRAYISCPYGWSLRMQDTPTAWSPDTQAYYRYDERAGAFVCLPYAP